MKNRENSVVKIKNVFWLIYFDNNNVGKGRNMNDFK